MKIQNLQKITVMLAMVFLSASYLTGQTVLFHEEFGDGLGEWTTVGYETPSAPDYDYENNLWVWAADARAESRYRPRTIESETASNGAALMFNEKYTLDENGGNPPAGGSPYPNIHSELISPVYDISGSSKIQIEWTQVIAELSNNSDDYVQASFSVKVDGGDWSENYPVPGLVSNGSEFTETLSFYFPEADDASTLQIKFISFQSFYYWLVDDVKIIEANQFADLAVTDVFITPARYMQPAISIPYDTFYFSFDIANYGTADDSEPTIIVRVVNQDTEEVVYTDSRTLAEINLGPTTGREDSLTALWAPVGLTVGTYAIEYEISTDKYQDVNPDNNMISYEFEVSDNVFGMDDDRLSNRPLLSSGSGYDVGMLYKLPKEVQGDYVWTKIHTAYDTLGNFDLEDHSFTLNFLKIAKQEVCDNLTLFNRDGPPPSTNEQFDQLGSTFYFLSDYTEEERFELELIDINTGEELSLDDREIEKDACYVFFINIPIETLIEDEVGSGVAMAYRPYSRSIEQGGGWRPVVYNHDRARYFTGGRDGSRTPVLRAEFMIKPVSNEESLPENSLAIYPNPTSNIITADISFEQATDVTVVIADMQGVIQSITVEKNVTQSTIQRNVSDLASGTYIFRIVTEEGARNTKFIKQ